MKIHVLSATLMIVASVVFCPLNGQTQDQILDIKTTVQGIVKKAKAGSIEIANALNDTKVKIMTNSNTEYNNVQKLTDLRAGDKVQIEYQISPNKNIATVVTRMEMERGDVF